MKFSSFAELEVVKKAISSAASDENFARMTTYPLLGKTYGRVALKGSATKRAPWCNPEDHTCRIYTVLQPQKQCPPEEDTLQKFLVSTQLISSWDARKWFYAYVFQTHFMNWYLAYLRNWWVPQNRTNDKLPLVQVMAWCRQATSY